MKFTFFIFVVLFNLMLDAQIVVINSYFNATDQKDEWVELVVVKDSVDMRNWTIRDNTTTQTNWQTAVTFSNIDFWRNMRRGTVIVIYSRIANTSAVNYTIDSNKNDGYLELTLQTSTLFNGGSFGTAPAYGGATMDIGASGDVIQLRDAGSNHIHAIGHRATVGSDWTALSTPKMNHATSVSSGEVVMVCPGRSLSQFNGVSGTLITAASSTQITRGLPNTCTSSSVANTIFIDSLRQPDFTTQTVSPTVTNFTEVSFSWVKASSPILKDTLTRYLVLRNTSNVFTHPNNGTTYAAGGTLGSALILDIKKHIDSTSITDNTVMIDSTYFYRVYAYKYLTDNINGNTFHQSRGAAYDTARYVSVMTPVILTIEDNNAVSLSENCDGFGSLTLHSSLPLPRGLSTVYLDNSVISKDDYYLNYISDVQLEIIFLKKGVLDRNTSITLILKSEQLGSNHSLSISGNFQKCQSESLSAFYPNPAQSILWFNRGHISERKKVEIFDLSNKLQLSRTFLNTLEGVDISFLKPGLYTIIISEMGNLRIDKLIVLE